MRQVVSAARRAETTEQAGRDGRVDRARRGTASARHGVVAAVLAVATLVVIAGCATTPVNGTPAVRGPTATPTAEQHVAALAQRAAGSAVHSVVASFGAAGVAGGVVTLTATVSGAVPGTAAEITASQERVKAICFRMEQALWTSGMPLREVVVTVVGPIYDDYADLTTGPYGAVDLKAATAAKLDWTHLSPDVAWDTYAMWLRPAYRSQVLGK